MVKKMAEKSDLDMALGNIKNKVHKQYKKKPKDEQDLTTLFSRILHQETTEETEQKIFQEIRKFKSKLK